MRIFNFAAIFLTIITLATSAFAMTKHDEVYLKQEAEFAKWQEKFKKSALHKGIKEKTIKKAFKKIKLNYKVVKADKKQFKPQTFAEYYNNAVNDLRIERARNYKKKYSQLLSQISEKYKVPPEYILALWAKESDFGGNTGSFYVVNSLANLAFEGRRRDFFESELVLALKMIQTNQISIKNFKGSWAGATGQCQFMPSSFYNYAVDFNKDGKKDIWKNKEDIFASIANYLHKERWRVSQSWGFEAKFKNKSTLEKYLNSKKKVSEWLELGLQKLTGEIKDNELEINAELIKLDNRYFLTYPNHGVIKHWNNSTFFATTVGLLADKIK
jgi:membrane-bound lytic murein transglycosylase B